MALDVLDHHNGIIHHDSDGQHHAEQRQGVNGEPEGLHARQSADEGDRHGHRGNQRRPPALQEQVHDEHDQHHRDSQRQSDLMDGDLDEAGRVIGDVVLHAGGKALGELIHLPLNALGSVERVGARRKERDEKRVGLAVPPSFQVVGLGAQLDLGHVLEADHVPVRERSDNHFLKVFHLRQAALRDHRDGELRAFGRGLPPDRAGGKIPVLLADHVRNVARREVELRHPYRVQDQSHAIVLAPEDQGVAHAAEPFDVVEHVDDRVVGQIERIESRIAGTQRHDRQQIR